MEVLLDSISKRFQFEWIFRGLSLRIPSGSHWAVTGSNGSGKSTLLKCISGVQPLSEGSISYYHAGENIPTEEVFNHLMISAPYLELPEEFTLGEFLSFHFSFKPAKPGLTEKQMVEIMYLNGQENKPISQFSSGMKQRLKLGICFFSKTNLILLDEPSSNLDERGVAWYLHLIQSFSKDTTILVCSNDQREYGFCENLIEIEQYKTNRML
jgi:ABC-type multidrug transport system ATPase subunit